MDPFVFIADERGVLAAESALDELRLFLHTASAMASSTGEFPSRVGAGGDDINFAVRAQLYTLEDMLRVVTDARLATALIEDEGEILAIVNMGDEVLRFIVTTARDVIASQRYDSFYAVSDDDDFLDGGLPGAGESSRSVATRFMTQIGLPGHRNRDKREHPPGPLGQFSDFLGGPAAAYPEPPKVPLCIVCNDELSSLAGRLETPCGHFYCPGCVSSLVKTYISQPFPLAPLRCCPGPLAPIPPWFVYRFIDNALRMALGEKIIEAETPFDRRIYCPQDDCRKFIDLARVAPAARAIGSITCPNTKCRVSICLGCRELVHQGVSCERNADDTQATKIQRQFGWGRCPGCRFVVEKVSGCSSVSCTRCGLGFTYAPMARN
ncbi:hypothetical protein P691DRAFT_104923 [Macrolepiota fuliginosa MF-IS2]|uniref:RBR-type E3 ubiquitin transferase n=1 Tax=Macrolepiota fuliginosa MF-IS2 TaxID=1400762 RepID=A0A9P6C3V0_9AGAR|nr:hypothetical protein P691DRAFT_104923 [Macrolepiota fuliginosa MF-IS2]